MELGAFSISLAVKDIEASRRFYEKFGFRVFAGDASQNWLIVKNGDHTIGLFQGMFEKNILTFNPGWDSNAQTLGAFSDVRELQRQLKAQGVELAGGGRKHNGARQLRRRGPRWQSDPGRPACVSRSTQGAPERVRATACDSCCRAAGTNPYRAPAPLPAPPGA